MNRFINNWDYDNSRGFDHLKIIGYFSSTDERTIEFNASKLRYYIPQKNGTVNLDLNEGIETTQPYVGTYMNRNINKVLHWLLKYYEKFTSPTGNQKWIRPDFVCRRGTIEKILRISARREEDTIICAAKWKGIIYLCKFDTDATAISKITRTPIHGGLPFWTDKFVQCIVSETANASPDINKPVNQNAKFNCIFHGCLRSHTLLYSAEMKAVCSNKMLEDPLSLDELEFIEIQTARIHENGYHRQFFENNVIQRWWSQCVPVGVDKIICGFRDEYGIVKEMKNYSLDDLINMSKIEWHPAASINYLDEYLTYIASVAVNDCDRTIYKFEKNCYGDIEVTEESPSSRYSFLPEWYTRRTL